MTTYPTINTQGATLRQKQTTAQYGYGLSIAGITATVSASEYCQFQNVGVNVFGSVEPTWQIIAPFAGTVNSTFIATVSAGTATVGVVFRENGQNYDNAGDNLFSSVSGTVASVSTLSVTGLVSAGDWIDGGIVAFAGRTVSGNSGTMTISDVNDAFSSATLITTTNIIVDPPINYYFNWIDNGVSFTFATVLGGNVSGQLTTSTITYSSRVTGIHSIHCTITATILGITQNFGSTPSSNIAVISTISANVNTSNQVVDSPNTVLPVMYGNLNQSMLLTASVSGGVVQSEAYEYAWYYKSVSAQTSGILLVGQTGPSATIEFSPPGNVADSYIVYTIVQDDYGNVVPAQMGVVVGGIFSATLSASANAALPRSTVTVVNTISGGITIGDDTTLYSVTGKVNGVIGEENLLGNTMYYYGLAPVLSPALGGNRIESFVETTAVGGTLSSMVINVTKGPTTTYAFWLDKNGTQTALGTTTASLTPPFAATVNGVVKIRTGDAIDVSLKMGAVVPSLVDMQVTVREDYSIYETNWYIDGVLNSASNDLGTVNYLFTGGTHTFEAKVYNILPNQLVSSGVLTVSGTLNVVLTPSLTNQYLVGNTQTFVGSVAPSSIGGDSLVWTWLNGVSTLQTSTLTTTTGTLSSALSAGLYNLQVKVTDLTAGTISGISAIDTFSIGHKYAATISGTVTTIDNGQTVTDYAFGGVGTSNVGNIGTANVFTTLWWSGTTVSTIPAFNNDCIRSISKAGVYEFDVPRKTGSLMAIGDQIEFGYKGNQVFLGWIYSIDKKDLMKYSIVAYDGMYGLAQSTYYGDILRANATLGISDLLKAMALQVKLGTKYLGTTTVPAGLIPQKFGYKFSEGQAFQKLEALALGYGYVFMTDAKNNLYVNNYASPTVVNLTENVNGLVMQSKLYNPATKYGSWKVNGTESSGLVKNGSSGTGMPIRTLGGDWLLVQDSDVATLGTVAANYRNLFANGVWTVKMWTKSFYDPQVSGTVLYNIDFKDGTTLYGMTLTDAEISQGGNIVTFKGSQAKGQHTAYFWGTAENGPGWQYLWIDFDDNIDGFNTSSIGAAIGAGILTHWGGQVSYQAIPAGVVTASSISVGILVNDVVSVFSTVVAVSPTTTNQYFYFSDKVSNVSVSSSDKVNVQIGVYFPGTVAGVNISTLLGTIALVSSNPTDDTNLMLFNVAQSSGP